MKFAKIGIMMKGAYVGKKKLISDHDVTFSIFRILEKFNGHFFTELNYRKLCDRLWDNAKNRGRIIRWLH